jgi:non-specific serine/threonine protein kinase
VGRAEAVRLFVDRARAVAPTFALSPQNAAAVAQICWRLDGVPLAIEMAAARVAVLGVEQIASRLDERLRLLTGGGRTAPPRQRTLRAAVDWSHDLLTEDERVVFRRLSVFAGGWTLEAAEAVCGDPPGDPAGIRAEHVLDLLAQLVAKSLALAESRGGEARYRLLETIRQYARDRLVQAGEAAAVGRRHYGWMLGQAERARPAIALGPRRRDRLDRLETELPNLRAALEWCLGADPRAGLRLATALQEFWYWRGHHQEAQHWLDRLLAGAPEGVDDALGAQVLLCSGRFAYLQGDYPRAKRDLEESVRVYCTLADPAGSGWGLNFLGQVATVAGDLGAARARFEESLARLRLAEDDAGAFWALQCWGEVEFNLAGDVERARALHEEGLTLARKHGDAAMMGAGLFALGAIERTLGNDRQARDLMEQSLARYAGSGDRVLAGWVVASLGDLALARGDDEHARRLFHRGLVSADQIGYRKQIAVFLGCWAMLAMQQGEHARGARLFGAAIAVDPLFDRSLTRNQVAQHGSSLATARSRLGDAVFRAAWAEGQAMTREQAVAHALEKNRG